MFVGLAPAAVFTKSARAERMNPLIRARSSGLSRPRRDLIRATSSRALPRIDSFIPAGRADIAPFAAGATAALAALGSMATPLALKKLSRSSWQETFGSVRTLDPLAPGAAGLWSARVQSLPLQP